MELALRKITISPYHCASHNARETPSNQNAEIGCTFSSSPLAQESFSAVLSISPLAATFLILVISSLVGPNFPLPKGLSLYANL